MYTYEPSTALIFQYLLWVKKHRSIDQFVVKKGNEIKTCNRRGVFFKRYENKKKKCQYLFIQKLTTFFFIQVCYKLCQKWLIPVLWLFWKFPYRFFWNLHHKFFDEKKKFETYSITSRALFWVVQPKRKKKFFCRPTSLKWPHSLRAKFFQSFF